MPCLYVLNKIGKFSPQVPWTSGRVSYLFFEPTDAISIEELGAQTRVPSDPLAPAADLAAPHADLLYKIPNSVPISARDWLNIDELIEVRSLPHLQLLRARALTLPLPLP